ncbi:MAG: hypothetical protein IJR44_04010 [Neisseriaceae bacterium]|nr:hypothetical protein [Neisseriaceae bacterium]
MKLIFNRAGDLVCPYCKEIPYCHIGEYFCAICRRSFSTVTFEEKEIKKDGKERAIVFD